MIMSTVHQSKTVRLVALLALSWAFNAVAQDNEFQDLPSIATDELDQMRGGFFSDTGMVISIGIERSVLINGELVTSTTLTIPDLQRFSGTGLGNATLIGPAFSLTQNGPGNTFTLAPDMNSLGTVVQNTLNNQAITGMTKINATVGNIDLVRSMDLSNSASQMIGRSGR
jgi:hypothetical protein